MVIPIIMPIGGGGSGYSGDYVDVKGLDLPPLPDGWWWQVKDTGGSWDPIMGPVTVWLYGPGSIYHQQMQPCNRSRGSMHRAARKIIKTSQRRAHVFGGKWLDFLKETY